MAHTLLILFSLGLALGSSLLCAALLRMARSSRSRRALQGIGLVLPTLVLSLLTVVMAHFLTQTCLQAAPLLDITIAQSISYVGAIAITAALALNGLRALLLPLYLRRRTWQAPGWLEVRVFEVATDAGLRRTLNVRVAADSRPWALVAGFIKPHLVVSSGLVGLLDQEELEAVLCHEVLHIRRGDLWWAALGGVLHDLTWFLPATRRLFRLMLTEQEMACDDGVLGEEKRLAMASALARLWQAGLNSVSSPRGSLSFFSHQQSMHFEARVERLLDYPGTTANSSPRRGLLAVVVLLALFVPAQVGATLLIMGSMGCGVHRLLVG